VINVLDADRLRDAAKPKFLDLTTKALSYPVINTILFQPSVISIHICDSEKIDKSGKVTNLNVFNTNKFETLITWSDRQLKSKCIQSYEIWFLGKSDGQPTLLTAEPLPSNAFFHIHNYSAGTYEENYQVYAVYFE
jgi:hypothetical protein